MMQTVVSLVPDSMKILVVMAVGLCLIVGLISLRKALHCLAYVLLLVIAAPFRVVLFKMLPFWLIAGLILIATWRIGRVFAELLWGREAASHMIGILAADAVRSTGRAGACLVGFVFRGFRNARRAGRDCQTPDHLVP